jgi:hypothetical protein
MGRSNDDDKNRRRKLGYESLGYGTFVASTGNMSVGSQVCADAILLTQLGRARSSTSVAESGIR